MNAWRTKMMTDHQLTEMVLRVMREQLEEKIRPSAPEFEDMDNPANHPAVRGTAEDELTNPAKTQEQSRLRH